MIRNTLTTVLTGFMASAVLAGSAVAQAPPPSAPRIGETQGSAQHQFRLVTVADSLVNPWSIAFLPDGEMLITERPGRLRVVRGGRLLPTPVAGTPTVFARGQGGLLDVVPHPDFASNRLLYLSYSKPVGDSGSTTAVARGRLENDRLTDVQDIFVADTRGAGHYGSRLAFDGNGYLFITVGDRQAPPTGDLEAHPAQSLANHHGKVIRLHDDGRVPTDNPFVGRDGAKPEIFSYGHRNMQALGVHPTTGELWLTEHGPQGGDELNRVQGGKNYGWPVVGHGVNYRSGTGIHMGTAREGMEPPVHVWVPSIGVSGMTFYTGDAFPAWKGSMFAGGLVGEQLARFDLSRERPELAELLVWRQGRIRDVRQGPDGFIYLAFEDRQGRPTSVVRIEPTGRP